MNLQVYKNAQPMNSIFKDTMLGHRPIAFLHSQKYIHTFGESTISTSQTLLTLPSFPSKLKIHTVPMFSYKKEIDVKKYGSVSSSVSGNFSWRSDRWESALENIPTQNQGLLFTSSTPISCTKLMQNFTTMSRDWPHNRKQWGNKSYLVGQKSSLKYT